MKTLVLIDKQGREAHRVALWDVGAYTHPPAQVSYADKVWDFGAAKLDGAWYYYDVAPTTPTQEESILAGKADL